MAAEKWWQQAVFYQIYPRSFADSNGDGIGDFPGMIAHLGYLHELGIDAIWLSPHFPSPFLDCGYDISDYTGVGAEYGTLDDFKQFLHTAHSYGIRVVLDLVLNHSSHLHPWFQESRSQRTSPKRDWYIWRDPTPAGGPPNNWASIFGGSAWEYDAATDQYYYHAFLPEQPDLNWRNPEVKAAMWEAVRFWLDLGVDGFRLDAIATIFEDPDLTNHTLPVAVEEIFDANALSQEDYWQLLQFQLKQPGIHELMQELRTLIDSYPGDRVLVGEDEDVAFHGTGDDELHLVFNFPLLRAERLMPAHIRANQVLRLAALPTHSWPCNTLGNHDTPRSWSRYGDGLHDAALARLHAALLLTLKGTPFLYYGEELGMENLILEHASQLRDTTAINQYRVQTKRLRLPADRVLREVVAITRDRCRSPMQWNNTTTAGFSAAGATPWLPLHPNYRQVNVAAQHADPASLLNFYRRVLALRRVTPALVSGDYTALDEANPFCLAFLRHDAASGQTCLVGLNFSVTAQVVQLDHLAPHAQLLFSSEQRSKTALDLANLILAPFEVLIAELASTGSAEG
jgi:alpha-glucosidase